MTMFSSIRLGLIRWLESLLNLFPKGLMKNLRGDDGQAQARHRYDLGIANTFGNDRAECQIDNAAMVPCVNHDLRKLNAKAFDGNPKFLIPDPHGLAGNNTNVIGHSYLHLLSTEKGCSMVRDESTDEDAA